MIIINDGVLKSLILDTVTRTEIITDIYTPSNLNILISKIENGFYAAFKDNDTYFIAEIDSAGNITNPPTQVLTGGYGKLDITDVAGNYIFAAIRIIQVHDLWNELDSSIFQ